MVKRILTLVGLIALLAACSGGGTAPSTAPTAPINNAPANSAAPLIPTTRATPGTPASTAFGLPPLPTSTAGAPRAATPGTPLPATPVGTPRALPSAPPVAFVPAPWQPGDRTLYTVTARDTGQVAGTATFTLGREFETDTLSALLSVGSTQDRFVMGWATATFAPASEIRSIVTAQGTIDIRAEFHVGGGTVEVINSVGTTLNQINLPPKYYANDQLLMILRALPFKEGYQGALVVVPSQGDPATLNAVVTVTGQETINTPLGPMRSWRVEMQFENNPTIQVLWYSADVPNYLVKYDNGRYIYTVSQRP